jgi:hypothetical protein
MLSVDNHELELGAFLAKYPWSLPKPRKGRSCGTFNLILAVYTCHEEVMSPEVSLLYVNHTNSDDTSSTLNKLPSDQKLQVNCTGLSLCNIKDQHSSALLSSPFFT